MFDLSTHPVVGPAFADVIDRGWATLASRANRGGVPPADCDDIVAKAVERVSRLALRGGLAALVDAWEDTPRNYEDLDRNVGGLLGHYLKYEIADYLRSEARRSRGVERIATKPPSSPETASYRNLIVDLSAKDGIRADLVIAGDPGETDKLCELLYDRAGLSEMERRYNRWRRLNSDAFDFEFDRSLRPPKIARIKKSAVEKVQYYIHHGRPLRSSTGGS
jgi:hypothetical protein